MRWEHFLFRWYMGEESSLSRSIPEPLGVCIPFQAPTKDTPFMDIHFPCFIQQSDMD